MSSVPFLSELESGLPKLGDPETHRFASDLVRVGNQTGRLTKAQMYWVKRLYNHAYSPNHDEPAHPGVGKAKPPKAAEFQAPAPVPSTFDPPALTGGEPPAPVDLTKAVEGIIAAVMNKLPQIVQDAVDGAELPIDEIVAKVLPQVDVKLLREVVVKAPGREPVKVGRTHFQFEEVLTMVSTGVNVCLVGPAGSGKTTVCQQIAKALGRQFYMNGQMSGEHELKGFNDAYGKYLTTAFRVAFEHGGLWLCDEVDGSDPSVPQALNSALANGFMMFPDSAAPIMMHPDFIAMAAANTFGRGADRTYVGRNQLDGAFTDRFVMLPFDYDEELELQVAPNADWTRYVQKCRKAADMEKARVIISPRCSIYGGKLLAAGIKRARVAEVTLWKGIDPEWQAKIERRAAAL